MNRSANSKSVMLFPLKKIKNKKRKNIRIVSKTYDKIIRCMWKKNNMNDINPFRGMSESFLLFSNHKWYLVRVCCASCVALLANSLKIVLCIDSNIHRNGFACLGWLLLIFFFLSIFSFAVRNIT